MTDARIPERWLNDRRLQRQSPEHFRAFINALMWSVANRTDGRIEREDVHLIPHWTNTAAQAFVTARLFTPESYGWLITDYAATQTSRGELEALESIRSNARKKKARQREDNARKEAEKRSCPGDCPGDCPGGPHRKEGRKEGLRS